MKNRADKQTDDDKKQHIGDALAAENLAEKVCSEDEQSDDGNGQSDFTRRTAVGDLLGDRVDQTWADERGRNLCDGVVDSRQCVGGGDEVGLNHGSTFLVEQSPIDADENAAVAHGVVGRDERIVVARE